MSESRCREIAYSEPAIVATESFGVPVGNPKNIRSIQDVVDHPAVRVVVLPRAFEAGLLQAADVPEQQIVPISDTRSGLDAVLSGRADAFLLPTPSLEYLARSEVFEVTGPIEDVPTT